MFTEALQGLGVVVTQTTRFDPQQMKSKFIYWLDFVVDQMAVQAREQIRSARFDVDENTGAKNSFRNQAIASIPYNEMSTKIQTVTAQWAAGVGMPKGPSAFKTYGKMIGQAVVSFAFPWVGLAWAVSGLFGKKKKPKMAIPWNTIYAEALPHAQEATVQEELQRISAEVQQIATIKRETGEKRSAEASLFKMPEGILSISKGGALVIAPVGQSIIRKK